MSGPRSSEPARQGPPRPDPVQNQATSSGDADDRPTEVHWWQQMRRPTQPTPRDPAQPQSSPPQQRVYPAQQRAQQPAPQVPSYPQQYAQPASAQPKGSMRWLLIVAGVLIGAMAAAVVVAGLMRFGAFDQQVLDVNKAQQAVKQVITDSVTGYGVQNVTDVTCNNGKNPAAKKGDTFTCEVTVDGKKRQVRAVFIDDNGTYEVDRPR
ncbi:MAG: DUF4333 domain-containing protein [Mycobacteriaceae bacterium]|nr:DUF4333 domain-containing protein [Mycobacteriaceae bacterium]